jgi:hypothetical protein
MNMVPFIDTGKKIQLIYPFEKGKNGSTLEPGHKT